MSEGNTVVFIRNNPLSLSPPNEDSSRLRRLPPRTGNHHDAIYMNTPLTLQLLAAAGLDC